jgi:hypothetical protein
VQLGDVYGDLRDRLLKDIPPALRGAVVEAIRRLSDGERPWTFADPVAIVRFLLTAKANGNDAEAIGAALYELALVPDFELLSHPDKAPTRIVRNRDCVEKLTWSSRTERGRVLDLGLADHGFRVRLGNFAADAGLEDPRTWTRRIVLDRSYWGLAFNNWEFDDGGDEPDAICISDVEANLPPIGDDETDPRLGQLIGQRVLPCGRDGLRKFNVTFRVDPPPTRVAGLARFSLQVISKEHGPVGLVRTKAAWTSNRSDATVTTGVLNALAGTSGFSFELTTVSQRERGHRRVARVVGGRSRPLVVPATTVKIVHVVAAEAGHRVGVGEQGQQATPVSLRRAGLQQTLDGVGLREHRRQGGTGPEAVIKRSAVQQHLFDVGQRVVGYTKPGCHLRSTRLGEQGCRPPRRGAPRRRS